MRTYVHNIKKIIFYQDAKFASTDIRLRQANLAKNKPTAALKDVNNVKDVHQVADSSARTSLEVSKVKVNLKSLF